ncbi:hypothetical protein NL676_027318 [Syzygium grande]|nr:hypothetical protein NL676_027318 [Syzygium grande]
MQECAGNVRRSHLPRWSARSAVKARSPSLRPASPLPFLHPYRWKKAKSIRCLSLCLSLQYKRPNASCLVFRCFIVEEQNPKSHHVKNTGTRNNSSQIWPRRGVGFAAVLTPRVSCGLRGL